MKAPGAEPIQNTRTPKYFWARIVIGGIFFIVFLSVIGNENLKKHSDNIEPEVFKNSDVPDAMHF